MIVAPPRIKTRGIVPADAMGMAANPSSQCQTARTERIASGEWRIETSFAAFAVLALSCRHSYSLLTILFSLFATRYSLFGFFIRSPR